MTDRPPLWTLSNLLSVSRVFMLAPIVHYLLQEGVEARWWALVWIFLAILTDTLDGLVARALGQVTESGKVLDPLADKICIGVVLAVLVVTGEVPLWFFVLIVARDVLIVALAIHLKLRYGIVSQSNFLGKMTVTAVAFGVSAMILPVRGLDPLITGLVWGSVVLMVLSTLSYAAAYLGTIRGGGDRGDAG